MNNRVLLHRSGVGPGLGNQRFHEGDIGGRGSNSGTAGGDSGNPDGGTSRDSSRFNSGGGSSNPDPDPPSTTVQTGDFTVGGVRSIGGEGGGGEFDPDTADDSGGDSDPTQTRSDIGDEVVSSIGEFGDRVSTGIDNSIDDFQDDNSVDDAGDFGDDIIGRSDGPNMDDDLQDPDDIEAPDNQGSPGSDRIESPDLVDSINQQVEGRNINRQDVNIDLDRNNDGTATVTAELADSATFDQNDFDDAEEFDTTGGQSSTNTATEVAPIDTSPQPDGIVLAGTQLIGPGDDFEAVSDDPSRAIEPDPTDPINNELDIFESDVPSTQAGRRRAVSDFVGDNLGIDRETLTNPTQGGVVGAATLGVAAPEPVSTGAGAAVLGGVALGSAGTAFANELGTPEERDDLPGEEAGELGRPDGSPTVSGEVDIPDRAPSSTSGEVNVPNQQPSATVGEISVPDSTPVESGDEISIPDLDAGAAVGRDDSFFEPGDISTPSISRDEFEEPQTDRDAFDDQRDAFVFPGSTSESANTSPSPQTVEQPTTNNPLGTGINPGTGIDGSPNVGIGSRSQSEVDASIDSLSQSDAEVGLVSEQTPSLSASAAPAVNDAFENQSVNEFVDESLQPTETRTQNRQGNRSRARRRGRLRRPDDDEREDDEEDLADGLGIDLDDDIAEFDLDPLGDIDEDISQGV